MRAKNCDVFYGYVDIGKDTVLILMVEDHQKHRRWFSCLAPVENLESSFRDKSFYQICFSAKALGMKEFGVTPRFKRKILKVISYRK